VAALVERDASFLPGYAPEHVEWEFGRAATAPAVDLGGVSLIGRADRIDVGPEGIVVVDYKRTHAAPLAEIRRDRLVQLQLYAVAASRTMGLPVAGGLYRGLKERADRGFVLGDVPGSLKRTDVTDAAGMKVLLRGAVDAAVQAADDMRHGRIQATPSVRACAYCQAVSFCGRTVS
jgi:RecB family exonuclease